MLRKRKPRAIKREVLRDPDPKTKTCIWVGFIARLKPPLPPDKAKEQRRELVKLLLARKLSRVKFQEKAKALRAESHRSPTQFEHELGEAEHTYRMRARLRNEYRDAAERLRYVKEALKDFSPQSRLSSSRANLEKAWERTGVMPWEDQESPGLSCVEIARKVAERATADHATFHAFLTQEEGRLKRHLDALIECGRQYLGKTLTRGRRSALALSEFIVSVRAILHRYLKPPVTWQDVADVCRYFRPARLWEISQKDPRESLDSAFLFPNKEALRRAIRRP